MSHTPQHSSIFISVNYIFLGLGNKLSAYGTCFNSKSSIIPFVENLFSTFLGINLELVLVDNYSKDGTWETLKELQSKYNIQLYRKSSNRGLGRNTAFEKTEGDYTLSVDVDEIFLDTTYKNIFLNHTKLMKDDTIVNFELSHRYVIEKAGNWNPNLNASEDIELRARILKTGGKFIAVPAILKMDANVLNGKNKGLTTINEYRYVKGFPYIKRLISHLADVVKGGGLEYSDLKYYSGYQKIALLSGLSLNKIRQNIVYRHFESLNNLQAAESAKIFIDPRNFMIPENRMQTTMSPFVGERIILVNLNKLRKIGYNFIYDSGHNFIISFLPFKGHENNLMKKYMRTA